MYKLSNCKFNHGDVDLLATLRKSGDIMSASATENIWREKDEWINVCCRERQDKAMRRK